MLLLLHGSEYEINNDKNNNNENKNIIFC